MQRTKIERDELRVRQACDVALEVLQPTYSLLAAAALQSKVLSRQ